MATIHIYAPLCIAAGAIFPPVCATLVALRFKGRKVQDTPIGFDDWFTVPPLVLLLGMCIAVLYGTSKHAIGYRSPPLPPGETIITVHSFAQSTVRSIYWSIEVMQVPALGCLKASLLLFYRRIFHLASAKRLSVALDIALAITLAWTIAFFFVFLLICHRRFDAYWTTLRNEKLYCEDTVMIHNAYGVSDVVLDLMVIIIPIPMLWPLQMSLQKKLGVWCIFLLGALSVVASMFRMVTYLQSTAVEFKAGTDTLILITGGIYWSLVECGLALICCCLPTVQSAFRKPVVQTMVRVTKLNTNDSKRTASDRSQSSLGLMGKLRQNSGEQFELQNFTEAEAGSSVAWSIDRKTKISVAWSNKRPQWI